MEVDGPAHPLRYQALRSSVEYHYYEDPYEYVGQQAPGQARAQVEEPPDGLLVVLEQPLHQEERGRPQDRPLVIGHAAEYYHGPGEEGPHDPVVGQRGGGRVVLRVEEAC
ncbi:hypothetical protein D1872_291330 [compost metagenome]